MKMLIHSYRKRTWLGPWPLLLGLFAASACADARGRFEDYRQRRTSAEAGVDESLDPSGTCTPPEPGTVTGPALLAVDTSLSAGKPILFLGNIDTPAADGTTAVHFVYHALDSLDRSTRVGEELVVGPYQVNDGLLVAGVPSSTLPGEANPIVHGVAITSEMTLTGHICGVRRFYCGTLTGSTSGYVTGPFTGHFGITLLDGPDAVPARPRFGCAASDLAEPLPN